MKEHIHLKISASDKQELTQRAKHLGLSLSGYIRFKLKEDVVTREDSLKGIVSYLHNRLVIRA